MENIKPTQQLQREAAELELEYWKVKVETAKIDREIHSKLAKYFEENIDSLVRTALAIRGINSSEKEDILR